MNLSASWVDRLRRHGFEAVHWSNIGGATAPDDDIPPWARAQQWVVITNGLDFSATRSATSGHAPSVVQVRIQDVLSDAAVGAVATGAAA